MQGLTEDQIDDLKLTDEWQEKCLPNGGFIECEDKVGRRCGKAPNDKMAEIINKTRQGAKGDVSKVGLPRLLEPQIKMKGKLGKGKRDGREEISFPFLFLL